MSDYYDSWSASSNKKKSPARPHLHPGAAVDRVRQRHLLREQASPNTVALSPAVTALRAVTSPSDIATFKTQITATSPQPSYSLPSFSPALLSAESSWSVGLAGTASSCDSRVASEGAGGSSITKRPNSVWRFSRILFEAATKPALKEDASYNTDFDDAVQDEDDEDDDDEEEDEDDELEEDAEKRSSYFASYTINITPRASVISPAISSQRRSGFFSEYQPRLLKVRELDDENTIEQVNALEDLPSSPSFLDSMARSHPSLLALSPTMSSLTVSDHPVSTSTFNARLHPISIMRPSSNTAGADHGSAKPGKDNAFFTTSTVATTATTAATRRKQGQLRPRPWSQVIWQSPVLGDASRQQGAQHRRAGSSGLDAAYSTLSNDMFSKYPNSPAKSKESDGDQRKDTDKNVRINMERETVDTGATSGGASSLQRVSLIRQPEGGSTQFPLVSSTQRREQTHGRSVQKNRLSLGSAFYASLEPVSLSAATPFTPRVNKRHHLIRLPVRPQSVLIPSSPRPYSQGPTLQPVAIEASKRQRHRSQQLETARGRSPLPVPIPWAQFQRLGPMKAEDSSHTFHGLGSLPTVAPPLPRGGSQDGPLEGSTSVSMWPESLTPQKLQSFPRRTASSRQQQQQQQQQWQGQSPRRQRNSRFLSALFESPSSFFKKPVLSSSQPSSAMSSPKSGALSHSPAFTSRFRTLNLTSDLSDASQHAHPQPTTRYEQQLQRQRQPVVQTRQSLPARALNTNAITGGHGNSKATPAPAPPPTTTSTIIASTTPSKTSSLWQRNSSSVLFPFSLVSYESGGLLGGIKNTSSTICTNAPSSVIAPGTPLPPGTVVTTGVPSPPSSQRSGETHATFIGGSTRSSRSNSGASERNIGSPDACDPTTAMAPIKVESSQGIVTLRPGEDEGDDDGDGWKDGAGEDNHGVDARVKSEARPDSTMILDGSITIQKSHVAVYEINPRWGSRLIMLLATLGGLLCVVSGGLCAEHHCRDLQLCSQDYQSHGDWCGPSGVDGAPYLLAVGLFMCTFGFYALVHLRSPISRLVGYSEIDQFL